VPLSPTALRRFEAVSRRSEKNYHFAQEAKLRGNKNVSKILRDLRKLEGIGLWFVEFSEQARIAARWLAE